VIFWKEDDGKGLDEAMGEAEFVGGGESGRAGSGVSDGATGGQGFGVRGRKTSGGQSHGEGDKGIATNGKGFLQKKIGANLFLIEFENEWDKPRIMEANCRSRTPPSRLRTPDRIFLCGNP
jgi:hypothetical protein